MTGPADEPRGSLRLHLAVLYGTMTGPAKSTAKATVAFICSNQ
jgi:hypothetical protein